MSLWSHNGYFVQSRIITNYDIHTKNLHYKREYQGNR